MKMPNPRNVNDSAHWYMNELSARVVAESGRPSDRHHLGKLILQGLKDAPDFILQIDGGTGKSETNASVLQRSVKCAVAMKNYGLQLEDVIDLWAPNHLDIAIVYYAALYLGVTFSAIDKNSKVDELTLALQCDKPKLIFCQTEHLAVVHKALEKSELEAEIITFDENESKVDANSYGFAEFLSKYGDDTSVDDFRATDFDPENTIASIIGTSGSTGAPKKAMMTHKNFAVTGPHLWTRFTTFPTPTKVAFVAAPIQWVSTTAHFNFSAIMRYTRLQSSAPSSKEHLYYLINTYRPTFLATSASVMVNLVSSEDRDQCDFSSFELVLFGGSSVSVKLLKEVRQIISNADAFEAYGFTEASTYFVFEVGSSPIGSCGKPTGYFQYRLVNIETQKDITEPNKSGELWVKGPGVCKGYYNNPEATKEALTDDGWFKTGDIMYRDDDWNFYFVDRMKMLIRCRHYLISPAEVEDVIRQHPGVFDVAVSELPDTDCMGVPVACVVRRPGYEVSANDIKELVKEKLDDWKQLRGGVVFLEELPLTSTTKIDRRKLKEIVLKERRE